MHKQSNRSFNFHIRVAECLVPAWLVAIGLVAMRSKHFPTPPIVDVVAVYLTIALVLWLIYLGIRAFNSFRR